MEELNNFKTVFEPELIQKIEEIASLTHVKEGDYLLDYGQIVRSIPILISGTVKVMRMDEEGRELLLYYVNSQESCAMTFTCCMEQFPSEIKAIAEKDVTMISIPVKYMDEWLMKYPTWKSFIMRTIQNRFTEMLNTIDQIAFQKLDERLIHYLKQKSTTLNSKLINISHEEIANDLATSRVVISRLLKKLENDKQLLLYRNQIKLLNEFGNI